MQLKKVMNFIVGFGTGCMVSSIWNFSGMKTHTTRKTEIQPTTLDKEKKYRMYYNVLNQWMLLKNRGVRIADIIANAGCKNIAIYGMGELGRRLYEELRDSELVVSYCIDNMPQDNNYEVPIISSEEEYGQVDLIIVTPVYEFDDIKNKIQNIYSYRCESLQSVVFQELEI